MMDSDDKREFTRVGFHVDLRIQSGQRVIEAQAKDVSLSGVFCDGTDPLPVGQACDVTLLLGGSEEGLSVQAKGKVARHESEGMAIEFVSLEGQESYDHLRQIVLHNSPDAEKTEQEFESHWGIRKKG